MTLFLFLIVFQIGVCGYLIGTSFCGTEGIEWGALGGSLFLIQRVSEFSPPPPGKPRSSCVLHLCLICHDDIVIIVW